MAELSLSVSDVIQHVVKFGIDIYPPIEISSDRTRLNMFHEEVRQRHPDLYEQLVSSDQEFKIGKQFRRRGESAGPGLGIETFVLTPRGPVFVFPLLLPEPVGATGLEDRYRDLFEEVEEIFRTMLPRRKRMRVGLIREVVFGTGDEPCLRMITGDPEFAAARLTYGGRRLHFRDAKCNVRLQFDVAEMQRTTQLPVGKTVTEPGGHGIQVILDVNNLEVHELNDADIEEVLTRATSLWPDELLKYLNGRICE